jgi:hypothetical protein
VWADIGSRWGSSSPSDAPKVARASLPTGLVQPLQQNDFIWPSLSEISTVQCEYFSAHVDIVPKFTVENNVYFTDSHCIFIPPDALELKLRILIISHCGLAGHRGIKTTLNNIRSRFYWESLAQDVSSFCKQCLHCTVNQGGNVVPRPYGPAVHASTRNTVLHFDYLQIDLSREKQFKYIFVVRDDLTSFTELFPCLNPTASFAAECLVDWITRYGIPSVFVSDRGSHFLNSLIEDLCLKLHISHHFTLAYCPWSNGTIEVINRHILFVFRSLISELRLDLVDWPILIHLAALH